MLRFNVTVRLIASRVALAVVNSCRRVLSLIPALRKPSFITVSCLCCHWQVSIDLRAHDFAVEECRRGEEVEPKEKICFFSIGIVFFFLVTSCVQCQRGQGAETPHINSCTSRRWQARSKAFLGGVSGGADGGSRVMSSSRVDGERFIVSADCICHVKPNNREPHGLLPATARPRGLCSVAHQTHQIASETHVYDFGAESSDSWAEKTESRSPGKKQPCLGQRTQLNVVVFDLRTCV